MAQCGIVRIDELLAGRNTAIARDDGDREAVGVVQDFLTGHGFAGLPDVRSRSYGLFGPKTEECVRAFQQKNEIPITGAVDQTTLTKMVQTPSANPVACRGYLTLALDQAFTGMLRVMSVTTQFEGAGRFGAINGNTDKAGLSFGLIQWAQKPLRLYELLRAFDADNHDLFVKVFGGGDAASAAGLLGHTAQPKGGVNDLGETTNPKFNLIQDPWVSRFRLSTGMREFQRSQVRCALSAFTKSMGLVKEYAPEFKSERSISFALDLANQFGDGGARGIYKKVRAVAPNAGTDEILLRMQQESVEKIRNQFRNHVNRDNIVKATEERREAFRTTPLLSEQPFNAN